MKIEKCFFTNATAEVIPDFHRDEFIIHSDGCGSYIIAERAIWKFFNTDGKPQELDQPNLNCARRCLEIRKENPGAIAIWTTRSEEAAYKKRIDARNSEKKSQLVLCVVEDVMEEAVVHADKPYELLKSFSFNLANKKAFSFFKITQKDLAWARIVDLKECLEILRYLVIKQFINVSQSVLNEIATFELKESDLKSIEMQISVLGWEALKNTLEQPLGNKVFIATAFSWPENSEVRIGAIQAIKDACRNLGYEAEVVSPNHTESITNRIMTEIKQSRFVIAELTYHNRGVYFESGYARGLGKNVFHIVKEGFTSHSTDEDLIGKKIHFDIAQVQYRIWSTPENLKSILQDWIEVTIGKY
jgi:hypothetical protein